MIFLFKKITLFVFFILLISCNENKFNQQNTLVPEVNVNTSVSLNTISFAGSFTIKPGHGSQAQGIIIFNLDGNHFKAFDLACPYININDCKVSMQVDQATGVMSCAGCANDDITFTQYKTGVTINETEYYLREYNAYLDGSVVRITNF